MHCNDEYMLILFDPHYCLRSSLLFASLLGLIGKLVAGMPTLKDIYTCGRMAVYSQQPTTHLGILS